MKKVQLRYQHPRFAIVKRPPVRDFLMVATPPPPLSKVQADEREALFAPTVRELLIAASKVSGIGVFDLISPRREKRICHARQAVMVMARKYTTLSFPQIGRHLGGRDHSTIKHALDKHAKNPEVFSKFIDSVLNLLAPPVESREKVVSGHPAPDNCAMV